MLNNVSIKTKLFGGVGLLVVALAGLVVFNLTGLKRVSGLFDTFQSDSIEAQKVNTATQNVILARLAVLKFGDTGDEALAEKTAVAIKGIIAEAGKVRSEIADPQIRAKLETLESQIRDYGEAFHEFVLNDADIDANRAELEKLTATMQKGLDDLARQAYRDGSGNEIYFAGQALGALLSGQEYINRVAEDPKGGDIDLANGQLEAVGKHLSSLNAMASNVERRKAASGLSDQLTQEKALLDALHADYLKRDRIWHEQLAVLGTKFMADYRSILQDVVAAQNDVGKRAGVRIESIVMEVMTIGIVATLIGAVIALYLGVSLSQAIRRITGAMTRLAGGDLEVEIFGVGRKDEIGSMASAVGVFKENAIEKVRLEAEQKEIEARAAEERQALMERMANEFEEAVGTIVDTVAGAATELQAAAETMTAAAADTNDKATSVAAASEEATSNVQAVATASEEMAASVEEIGRQASDTASGRRPLPERRTRWLTRFTSNRHPPSASAILSA